MHGRGGRDGDHRRGVRVCAADGGGEQGVAGQGTMVQLDVWEAVQRECAGGKAEDGRNHKLGGLLSAFWWEDETVGCCVELGGYAAEKCK